MGDSGRREFCVCVEAAAGGRVPSASTGLLRLAISATVAGGRSIPLWLSSARCLTGASKRRSSTSEDLIGLFAGTGVRAVCDLRDSVSDAGRVVDDLGLSEFASEPGDCDPYDARERVDVLVPCLLEQFLWAESGGAGGE